MRRILLCVAVLAALALGACGGGKSNKKAIASAAGTNTSVTAATPSGESQGGATATSAPGAQAATATTAKPATQSGTSSNASAATPTTAKSAAGASASNTGSSGGAPKLTPTPAGHYHYAVTGTSTFGPQSSPPPPGADLTVDAPQGTSQHTRLTVQGQNGQQSTTDTTYDNQADGLHLVDLTTATAGFTMTFHPSPPPLIQPPLKQGASVGPFDMTSTDGKTIATVKVTVQAVDQKVALGDGTSANTVQIEVDTVLKCASGQQCSFTGSLNSTRWLRSDGLTIKDHSVTDGNYTSAFTGSVAVKSDTTSVVDKGNPA